MKLVFDTTPHLYDNVLKQHGLDYAQHKIGENKFSFANYLEPIGS